MKEAAISATYVDHMGSDLSVVNAARVSFSKESDWLPWSLVDYVGAIEQYEREGHRVALSQADAKLIKFLALGYTTQQWDNLAAKFMTEEDPEAVKRLMLSVKRHADHWAPFAHPHISIRVKTPLFIARQMVKHQIGGVWSEVSRRYVDEEPDFYFPAIWHDRPENVKQGSGGVIADQRSMHELSRGNTEHCLATYNFMLEHGVAPEEARIHLPLNTMTEWVWTGSLAFWARVANQRLDGHAQLAAQETARHITSTIQPHYPVSWAALVE